MGNVSIGNVGMGIASMGTIGTGNVGMGIVGMGNVGMGIDLEPAIIPPMLPKTLLNVFKTRKKHFAIFGFCLFFDDVIILTKISANFPYAET